MALYTFRGSQWIPGERIKSFLTSDLVAKPIIDFHLLKEKNEKLVTACPWFLDVTEQTSSSAGILFMKDVQAVDVEVLVRYNKIAHTGTNFANNGPTFMCRRNNVPGVNGLATDNGYSISRQGDLNQSGGYIRRRDAGVANNLVATTGGYTGSNIRLLRLRVNGTILSSNEWDADLAEPAWQHTYDDTDVDAITATGYFGFGAVRGGNSRFGTQSEILDIGFATDGDTVPLPSEWWTGSLAGETENVDEVILLDWQSMQPIGRVVPDAITGAWEFDELLPNTYGLVYVKEGCGPQIHGPYAVVEAP